MIRFFTLGKLDLRGAESVEMRAVLQQPKRLGLLAYLAVASPRRFHRRDTLLGLFWPELDQEHARAALRRSLYFLRAELGPGVIDGRGDDEIGVPEQTVWCDATALEHSMALGKAEEALSLYRGPFLEGLYVAGAATEYQEWLERERRRLRTYAATAARSLADRCESEGLLGDAVQWCRRALELGPDEESALQRLLTLLDRSGDRSGALKVYDEFARHMAHGFQLEPSAETRQLVEGIRHRPLTLAGRNQATGFERQPLSAARVAVLPFSVRGDARFAYLKEGMVDLLATKLDGAGELRTVDHRALLRFVTGDGGLPAAVSGRAVAEHFEAGSYLEGSLVEAGGRLQVVASLYTIEGEVLANASATAGSEDEIFELVDELARQLLAARGGTSGTRLTRLAGLTTTSLDALKCYLRGEGELRRGRYFDALEAFQSAIDADATFALAYYRWAASAAGCALPDLAREVSDRGFEYRQRLSQRDQLVFSAQRAWLHGSVDEAESLFDTIIGTYPDDLEAWFHLGDLLVHSNPLRGRSSVEARDPLERVLKLQPDHVGAMVHLVRVSAVQGRKEETLSLIERVLEVSPSGDQALAMRALRAYTMQDRAAIDEVTAELHRARAVTVAIAFSDVALYSGDLHGAEELALSFIQVARSQELRALCHTLVAHVALARGADDVSQTNLKTAESLHPLWGLEMRALFSTLPFRMPSDEELRSIRHDLASIDASAIMPSTFAIFAMHNDSHAAIRAYLLGLIDLRLGNLPSVGEQLKALVQLSGPEKGLSASLSVELQAAAARAQGAPHEALDILQRSRPRIWFQLTVASPFFSLASQRFLRAELLRELGRVEEASSWYGSIAERSPYEIIYSGPARQRLAEMILPDTNRSC
jgi:DNA-binding SARP family transcriptional activator